MYFYSFLSKTDGGQQFGLRLSGMKKWKNPYHSYSKIRRVYTRPEVLAWIGFYSVGERMEML